MDFDFRRSASITAFILLVAAVTQGVYTAMYIAEMEVPRRLLWGGEAVLFTLLAAFAGSALAQTRRQQLVFSAITAAAVLNVVQVGVGLTMFGPFRAVAEAAPETAPLAGSIVAFSFMVYNAAKVLLALALIVAGLDKLASGARALGAASAIIGVVALVSNALSTALGRDFSGDLPIAGGSGVLATVLLAVCLLGASRE